jgi:hypothetical protein
MCPPEQWLNIAATRGRDKMDDAHAGAGSMAWTQGEFKLRGELCNACRASAKILCEPSKIREKIVDCWC